MTSCLICITMTEPPDPAQFVKAVLGFQMVLSLTGLDPIATVWPDMAIVTDAELNDEADQWADANPWM